MSEAKYPSKERVVRDDVLIYAEGDDIPETDVEELQRQGYDPDTESGARTVRATERIVQDDVLLYAEGDEIPAAVAERLGITNQTEPVEAKPAGAEEITTLEPEPKRATAKGKSK